MAIRSSIPMTFGEKAQEDFSVSHLQGEAAYRCSAHWHDCFELILVQKGTFTVILDGVPVGLAAGDLAVIPPHMLHATAGEAGAYDVLVLGYTEELIYSPEISIANLKFLLPFRWARPAEQWRIPDPGGLRKRFLDAAAAASKSAFHQSLIARSAILLLHAELYAYYMHDGAPEEKTEYSLAVERYIKEHITEDISPYAVAEALHISYSHLARLIKGDFGFPLGELICHLRKPFTNSGTPALTWPFPAALTALCSWPSASGSGFPSPPSPSRPPSTPAATWKMPRRWPKSWASATWFWKSTK